MPGRPFPACKSQKLSGSRKNASLRSGRAVVFAFGLLAATHLSAAEPEGFSVDPLSTVAVGSWPEQLNDIESAYPRNHAQAIERLQTLLAASTNSTDADTLLRARSLECTFALANNAANALKLAQSGLVQARQQQNELRATEFLLCRGNAYELTGQLAAAMSDYDAALQVANKRNDKRLQADALDLRGALHSYQGDHGKAVPDLQAAYAIYQELQLPGRIRRTLADISYMYVRVGEYEKSLEYLYQLLADEQQAQLIQPIGETQYDIARVFEMRGDFHDALTWFERARDTALSVSDALSAAYAEIGIGSALAELNRPNEALGHLAIAEKTFATIGDKEMLARIALGQGKAYSQLGDHSRAMQKLSEARAAFSASGNQRSLQTALDALWPVYRQQQNYQKALEAVVERQSVHQQLDEKQERDISTRLRMQFDTEKKEQENAALSAGKALAENALRNAQKLYRWQATALLLGMGLLLVLGVLVWRQIRYARRMQDLALTDELTGLPNRRHILAFGDSQMALQKLVSVLVIDVDYFKRINDHFGHATGDAVLKQLALITARQLRQHDRAGRVGGEEFYVILPSANLASARDIAERLRVSVEAEDFSHLGDALRVTISIGVAQRLVRESEITSVAQRADAALYQAKQAGRNRVICAE